MQNRRRANVPAVIQLVLKASLYTATPAGNSGLLERHLGYNTEQKVLSAEEEVKMIKEIENGGKRGKEADMYGIWSRKFYEH